MNGEEPEELTHGQKLDKILKKDLKEWFKDMTEDTNLNVQAKILVGPSFAAAIRQLDICVNHLRQYEKQP